MLAFLKRLFRMEKYPSNGTLTRIDNKLKGHLRAAPAARAHGSIQGKSNPIEPVNRLFGALMQRFVSDLPKSNLVLPKGVRASDWDFKRHRAQRFLKWKKKRPTWLVDCFGSFTALSAAELVYMVLVTRS
jgi:hypothetical protein